MAAEHNSSCPPRDTQLGSTDDSKAEPPVETSHASELREAVTIPPESPASGDAHSDLRGQKRPQNSDRDSPKKRKKPNPEECPQPLSRENLRKHTKRSGFMASDYSSRSRGRGSKRSSSSHSTITATDYAQETESSRSRTSSGSLAQYRFVVLKAAMVYIQAHPIPAEVQNQLDLILGVPSSFERETELSRIAHDFHEGFIRVLDRAAGEDDCVELLYVALSALGYSDSLIFARKADWRPCLKPRCPVTLVLDFVDEAQQEQVIEPSTVRPKKRQAGMSYISPSTSDAPNQSDINEVVPEAQKMPPPPAPSQGDTSKDFLVKTPRPDITVGLDEGFVVQKLKAQGLSNTRANYILDKLQQQMKVRHPNVPEPLLCSEPTQRAYKIRFPFLMVEGKSYVTGKPVFEAQNQAAVAGAGALKILHDLADIATLASASKDLDSPAPLSPTSTPPVVFSICTEGPLHELWAHYTVVEDGIRMYKMSIIKSCHGALREGVLEFLTALDHVMRWGTAGFLDHIAKQLETVSTRLRPAVQGS